MSAAARAVFRDFHLPAYSIAVAPGSLDAVGDIARRVAPAHRYVVITDTTVEPLYAARVAASFGGARVDVLSVPPGEAQKTRESWARLTDEMLARGVGRDGAVVALGGGVVGDLAGFVAGTFMRGIPYVQVPTTLLAMIDSSIGGKTGVDTAAGKNLVGVFHQPAAVVIDPEVLHTLPIEQRRAGAAEAIKHGIIADADYFAATASALPDSLDDPAGDAMAALIAGSIAIKARVVEQDEREAGLRKILNFGHTLGHAVEALSDYRLLHGEAIAIGMTLESRLAERRGIAEAGTASRVRQALERAGLPTTPPPALDPAAIVAATHGDKKARAGQAEYALPRRVGAMAGAESGWALRVSDPDVLAALEAGAGAEAASG